MSVAPPIRTLAASPRGAFGSSTDSSGRHSGTGGRPRLWRRHQPRLHPDRGGIHGPHERPGMPHRCRPGFCRNGFPGTGTQRPDPPVRGRRSLVHPRNHLAGGFRSGPSPTVGGACGAEFRPTPLRRGHRNFPLCPGRRRHRRSHLGHAENHTRLASIREIRRPLWWRSESSDGASRPDSHQGQPPAALADASPIP